MRRFLALTLCLLLLLPLYGCGGRELYERLLIHGIGVDVDGDGFLVTVRSSVSPEDEGEECFTCRGRSVLEALNTLTRSTGRRPFYAHNYLAVFGKDCAQAGLDRCLDFFVRYYNTRPAVRMYLSEGTAAEVVGWRKDGKYLKMGELQQLGDGSESNGRTVRTDVLDFINGVKRQGSSPVVPVLRAGEDGVELVSTAYFEGWKVKGFLSPEETRGYLSVKDSLKAGDAVVVGEGFGGVTLSLSHVQSRVEHSLSADAPAFHITLTAEADVSAVSGGRDRLSEEDRPQVEAALAQTLKDEVRAALDKAVIDDRCDVFGFGNLLYREEPAYWRAHGEDWPSLLPNCGFTVEVAAQVDA